jgi:hypothetical protein
MASGGIPQGRRAPCVHSYRAKGSATISDVGPTKPLETLSSLAEMIARGFNYRAVGRGDGPFEEVVARRRSLLASPSKGLVASASSCFMSRMASPGND